MTIVVIVGRILEKVDEHTRMLEITYAYKNNKGVFENFTIPARHWNKTGTCAFMQLAVGVSMCFKGRLEYDERIGIYLLVEQIASVNKI